MSSPRRRVLTRRVRGFENFAIPTSGAAIHGVRGGSGPPVLLLHGIPETHLMWHKVAPALAANYTIVATDLRGYGASAKPPSDPDHAPYGMRALANDQVEVMASLGFNRFAVVGHDRGARCAYRLALDHPAAVSHLAVMDIVPTGDAYARADREFAHSYWMWAFLSAPEPVPEQLISAAPHVLVDFMLDNWPSQPRSFPDEVRAAYIAAFRDPETVHAICEEYRAAATVDVAADEADRGGAASSARRSCCGVPRAWWPACTTRSPSGAPGPRT
ncbi:alpha/beta fold hydrolase [Phytohabitans flavus]|uniref:alpha/beta fold hydrolase n=1 Tax=Phytohabitans flavus TaxID=1076124 RepID=UPI00362F6489